MKMKKVKGGELFDGYRLWKDKVLVMDGQRVEAVVSLEEAGETIEEHQGILMPGLINCHCHLELSHLKGVVPPGTGLVDFLITVVKSRRRLGPDTDGKIEEAEREMCRNGIIAVADICNTAETLTLKKKSSIYWQNLVEVINFYDANLEKQLSPYLQVEKEFTQNGLAAGLTPHAPYTVSAQTFKAVNRATANRIVSVHNQETGSEDELFMKGSGDFLKLFAAFAGGVCPFPVSGKSSLQTWLPHFTEGQTILLVHNTFISEKDIVFAKEQAARYGLTIVYCVCPNANLYIEKTLPPIDLLLKHGCLIVLGTDSYSSNRQLSIAAEIKTLLHHLPHIPLETLLQWATDNGAMALKKRELGTFERGKEPGLVLLNKDDFSVRRLY
jgi:aminodeoxyfutalosine deaminase